MSGPAADFLHERSVLILAIRDVDSRLRDLLDQAGTYRASAEVRDLFECRAGLVDRLSVYQCDAPALPDVLGL